MPGIGIRIGIGIGGRGVGEVDWPTYWLTQLPIEQQGFLDLEYGAIIHYDITTYADVYPVVDGDPNDFAPTENITNAINGWLDIFVDAGMGYAILTAKHIAGFCLWPTAEHADAHDPYSIAQSSWYDTNGSPNVLKIFIDGCAAKGLKCGVYFSPADFTYDERQGVDHTSLSDAEALVYKQMMKNQLAEILALGTVDYLWFDTWGYWLPYSSIPYDEIREYIGSLQRNCLVINNNPGHSPWDEVSEIHCYERWDNPPPAENTDPAEHVVPNMVNQQWFYRNTMAGFLGEDRRAYSDFYTAEQVLARRQLVNARNGNLLMNASPNETGNLNIYEEMMLLGSNPDLLIYPYFATVEADDPDIVVINCIKAIDGTSVPAVGDFALAGKTITNVAVTANLIKLTVSVPYALGNTIAVSYTKPVANMIKDTVGNEMASFSNLTVANNIVATDIELLLTSTGTGAGVATINLSSIADVLIILGANAKFYSDAAGTLDESATWTCTAGGTKSRYLKCASGTATMTFDKNKIIKFGTSAVNGWVSSTNAPSLGGDISRFTGLQQIRITGNNTISGQLNILTQLTYLRISGSPTVTGDISNLALTYLLLSGSNTCSADYGLLSAGIQNCSLGTNGGIMIGYTSAGANWSSLINGGTIVSTVTAGNGLSATQVDQLLIDVYATRPTVTTLTITINGAGNAIRTSASDDAVAGLLGLGWTLNLNS